MPVKSFVDHFKKLYLEFTDCDEKGFYPRIRKVHDKVVVLNKNIKKKGNERKKQDFLEEIFLCHPDGGPSAAAERYHSMNEESETGDSVKRIQKESDVSELIDYKRDLQCENTVLKDR